MAAASSAEREMNLSALQQRDPYITGIADSASQVAVYSFNSNLNEWEKTNVEGTLFVYSRSAYPTNGFMIINRLHLNDLIEPINKNLEFQLQDPFLLYRNEKAAIYGIWFYDRDECARIGQLMNSLVQIAIETQQKETASGRQRRASESDTTSDARSSEAGKGIDAVQKNVDILQMLSKAQDEYDKSKAQVLRKSSTPTVTTNGNCAAGVGACSASPKTKGKGGTSAKCAEPNSAVLDGMKNSGGGAKNVKVLRPTAVKPPPLQMDLSKQGAACLDPSTTPNTQISLEVLFKRAVLQQDGNLQSNTYRRQQAAVPMVPTVAQLMSTQTGTTTVEELERQHHSNTQHRAEMSRAPAAEASSSAMANGPSNNAVMGFSCISTSMPSEPESPNTMLRRTLNLGPSLSDGFSQAPSRQAAAASQNCTDGVGLRNSNADALRRGDGAERKASNNAEAVASQNRTSTGVSQVISLSSPLGLPNLPSTLAAPSSSIPSASTIFGQVGPTLARFGTNNLKAMGQSSGASLFGGLCWSNSPQSDGLAPPENFQTAALKNGGTNILLSPMVFQASAGLSALNQVRMPEPLLVDLQSGTSAALHDRSPLSTCGEPAALPVNPLTRDQLQQALIHLLKNDSSFLGAIHEAYIASLNQELGSKTTRP